MPGRIPYATLNAERERVQIHDAGPLAVRLKTNGFRFDADRNVWEQRFRSDSEFLHLMAFVVAQRIALHEEFTLKPQHLAALKPCRVVRFLEEDQWVIEEIE